MESERCTHFAKIHTLRPSSHACPECVALGDRWVHLRLCTECGHIGCCDDSKNKHATKHYHHTQHPIIRSIEPGEEWGWCYPDELMIDFSDPKHPVVAQE